MSSMRIDIHKANFSAGCGAALAHAALSSLSNLNVVYDTPPVMAGRAGVPDQRRHVWQIPS